MGRPKGSKNVPKTAAKSPTRATVVGGGPNAQSAMPPGWDKSAIVNGIPAPEPEPTPEVGMTGNPPEVAHIEVVEDPDAVGYPIGKVEAPTVVPDQSATTVPVLTSNPLDGLGLNDLRNVAYILGVPRFDYASVGEIRGALTDFSAAALTTAVNTAMNEQSTSLIPKTWDGEKVNGEYRAVDPAGWFTALVRADGSAEVTLLGEPDLHNRTTTGIHGDDVTINVANLQDFINRLHDLYEASGL